MYKPTIKELSGLILLAVGTTLVLALTDFGLASAVLAALFIVLGEYRGLARKSTRGCKRAQS